MKYGLHSIDTNQNEIRSKIFGKHSLDQI